MRLQCFLLALNTVLFLQAPTSAQVNQRQAAFVDGLIKRYDTNSDGMLDGDEPGNVTQLRSHRRTRRDLAGADR